MNKMKMHLGNGKHQFQYSLSGLDDVASYHFTILFIDSLTSSLWGQHHLYVYHLCVHNCDNALG